MHDHKIILVDVPEGAKIFKLFPNGLMRYEYPLQPQMVTSWKQLPPSHTYLWAKRPSEMSEEEAAMCVATPTIYRSKTIGGLLFYYKNYMDEVLCTTAKASLSSLIKSLGKEEQNVLIVLKNDIG